MRWPRGWEEYASLTLAPPGPGANWPAAPHCHMIVAPPTRPWCGLPQVTTEPADDSARRSSNPQAGAAGARAALDTLRLALSGRYDIHEEIGRGAAGHVFRAYDRERGSEVAIKVLRDEFAAAVSTTRFLREVAIGLRLQHPRIIPVHDSGTAGRRPYYTMPFVRGQSLRERLQVERQLPLAEAYAIATQVASALDYAHTKGVIHRDVKPGNILLAPEGAVVADFGIARAVTIASGEDITDSGIALGTPEYMSPEQAGGQRDIDERADVYGLGCVVYEMLVGEPPFTGPTSQAIVARHYHEAPRSVRVVRPSVSEAAEAAIERALAKVPADRFATAGEFAAALTSPAGASFPAGRRSVPATAARRLARPATVALIVAASILVTSLAIPASREAILTRVGLGTPLPDPGTVAVFSPDTGAAAAVPELVRTAFAAWTDIRTVAAAVSDAEFARRSRADAPFHDAARRAARGLGAGRWVVAETAVRGDSMDLHLSMFDAASDSLLSEGRTRVQPGSATASATIDRLVDALLFERDRPREMRAELGAGTRTAAARRAYLRGHVALESGSFAAADSAFLVATRADADYPQALVWLALVRAWTAAPGVAWTQFVEQAARAATQRAALAPPDTVHLAALREVAAGRDAAGCSIWLRATRAAPYDFSAWYSAGACGRRDKEVVRSAASPTGWRFTASYEAALDAYERAFHLRPALLHAHGARSIADLQDLFVVSSARTRTGAARLPDSLTFRAYPTWSGDTIAYYPVASATALLAAPPEAVARAVQQQRVRFRDVARLWRTEFPRRADAAEAVAIALEMLGDSRALDTLRIARELATTGSERTRIAATEVLMRVKYALPDDVADLRAAGVVADSLFGEHPPSSGVEPRLLGSLAALFGRAQLAASYAAAGGMGPVAPAMAQSGPPLVAFASLGGPADSLRALEARAVQGAESLAEPDRSRAMAQWVVRAASLAFPNYTMALLTAPLAPSMAGARVSAAAVTGDSAGLRATLAAITAARRPLRPADVMIDGLYPEAAALDAIGDVAAAAARLDPTLAVIRVVSTGDLAQIPRAGVLVRALALRASLARRVGDVGTARRFAAAVVALWPRADPFLAPTLEHMQSLLR